ncbi:alpha/beta hydrolase family protein [Coralloluteibacterium stylophorae]|uniref:Peptidase S9 prolyl oligopeptidase catalytic domain-containing protein n=1 Tax=Coralloluteibacterium stylophorae TaxID=1776034 RepID=A0A8J8AWJ2_9GAMM
MDHHGNTAAEPRYLPEGFVLWWERADDLSVLLDALLADPVWSARIDRRRIGAAGFSLGGHTVMSLAGARTDLARHAAYCRPRAEVAGCRPPPEAATLGEDLHERLRPGAGAEAATVRGSRIRAGADRRDRRIRAVYAMAPALTPAFAPASLRGIDLPLRAVVGTDDDQAPVHAQVAPAIMAIPEAELEIVEDVGHYAFLARCTWRGRLMASPLCRDGGRGREALHRMVADDAAAFFDRALSSAGAGAAQP